VSDVYHRHHANLVIDSVDDPLGTTTRAKPVLHRREQHLARSWAGHRWAPGRAQTTDQGPIPCSESGPGLGSGGRDLNPRPLGYEPYDIGLSRLKPSLTGAMTSANRTDPVSLRRLCLPRLKLSRRVRFTNRFTKQAIDLRFPRLCRPPAHCRPRTVARRFRLAKGPRDRLGLDKTGGQDAATARKTASLTSDSAQADYGLKRVPATENRKGRGGMTLCLEDQANVYGIVRDVGKYVPVARC